MAEKKTKKKTTKRTTTTTSNYEIVKFCAFWGLVISAVAALLSFIFGIMKICGFDAGWLGRVIGVCNTVSQLALIVAAIIPAYRYSLGKPTVWRAFFWVAVIFIVLGLVGINLAF